MIEIKTLTFQDLTDVLDLIVKHYSQDLFDNFFQLKGNEIDQFNINRVKMHLKQSWSVGAFDKETNKIIAVSLNRVQEKGKPLVPLILNKQMVLSNELEQIKEFFDDLTVNSFDLLQTDKLFFAGMVTVHEMYRRNGIVNKLRIATESLARTAGCNYIVSTPTNEYLCRSALQYDYKVLKEITYLDYYSRNHAKIFENVSSPYIKAQLIYKKV